MTLVLLILYGLTMKLSVMVSKTPVLETHDRAKIELLDPMENLGIQKVDLGYLGAHST